MDVEKFSLWARSGGTPLRADDLLVVTSSGEFRGYGTLRISDEHFLLTMTIRGEEQLPEVSGLISREDFWKISGVIEDHLPFNAIGLAHSRSSHFGQVSVLQAEFPLGRLSFVSEATQAVEKSLQEQLQLLREISHPSESNEKKEECAPPSHFGYARLPGHLVLRRNAGTKTEKVNDFLGKAQNSRSDTFMGTVNGLKYALIKSEGDCEFHLRTDPMETPLTDDEFRESFDAFLCAVAFFHGREAWPQHRRIKRDFETIEEYVTPLRDVAHTALAPLNEGACARGANYGMALEGAVKFFLSKSVIVTGIKRYLHLCRQSGLSRTPLDVGTLSLCTIFEGIVKLLHDYYISMATSDGEAAFQQAKEELIAFAKKRQTEGFEIFGRLAAIVSSAKPLRPADYFHRLVNHFGLPKKEMELALAAWKAERNALAHGSEPSDTGGNRMFRQSRLAGGINLLVSKAMGYKGLTTFSAIEDHFVHI